MTETEAKIKDLELRVKKLEDKVFNTWLGQYEPETNWYEGLTAPKSNSNKNKWIEVQPEAFYAVAAQDATRTVNWNEVPPPIPTQACTNEQIEEAGKKWSEFIAKYPEYK